jgi:hypothetical protein
MVTTPATRSWYEDKWSSTEAQREYEALDAERKTLEGQLWYLAESTIGSPYGPRISSPPSLDDRLRHMEEYLERLAKFPDTGHDSIHFLFNPAADDPIDKALLTSIAK